MRVIFGLGNPEEKYASTRHNLGRRVVRALMGKEDRSDTKPNLFSQISERSGQGERLIVGYSLVFMNESGKAVGAIRQYYKINLDDILIIHDDVDILFGKMKLSFGSRSAGHLGVESVIQHLGSKDFWRLRIGVQPTDTRHRIRAEDLILKNFTRKEEKILPEILNKASQAIEAWAEHR